MAGLVSSGASPATQPDEETMTKKEKAANSEEINENGWSDVFGYNEQLAEDGVWFEYPGKLGSFKLAFMGTGSRKFAIRHAALLKPHARKVQMGDAKLERKILIEAFVDTILLEWKGVHDEGKLITFSKANAVNLLTKYGRLLDKLVKDASEEAGFRAEEAGEDAKNSVMS